MSATLEAERAPTRALLLDRFLPEYDATVFNHAVVDAEPRLAYEAIRGLDLAETMRESATLRLLMGLRGAPDLMRARLAGRATAPTPPERMSLLAPGEAVPGWALLGDEPDREVVVGAVGVFWTPEIRWLPIEPESFAGFAEPGYGKIAWGFSVVPYGECRSLVTSECRTVTTDAESRRSFLRYWRLVGPFASYVMRANLPVIERHAEAAARSRRLGGEVSER